MVDPPIRTSNAHIALVTEGGSHIWGIANALTAHFDALTIIVEEPESKMVLLKRRARKLGAISAVGQLATMVLVRCSKVFYARKPARPAADAAFDPTPPTEDRIVRIGSANSHALIEVLEQSRPRVVLLAGCRLLGHRTLAAIQCPVLNYHAGIAPKYRGMNGGYWALATGDVGNFGTTVHFVDPGVDTGAVLYQSRGNPAKGDTIATYALTQAAFSCDICIQAIEDILAGNARAIVPDMPSRQWYHPTIWRYFWTGISRGVW